MKFQKENWDSTRKKGFLHFFLFRGLLLFGLPITLMQIFMRYQDANQINYLSLVFSGLISGLIYSSSLWYFAERKFKRENTTNEP
jgi:hypothetical protein